MHCIAETAPYFTKNIQVKRAKFENPFKIFWRIKEHPLIFWMCLLALISSIPDAGVQNLLANYAFDVLHICKEGNSTNPSFVCCICYKIFKHY